MSDNSICKRRAEKVSIGYIQMYCDHFILTGHTQFYEKTSLMGHDKITAKCPRSTKITFIGRMYRESDPLYAARIVSSIGRNMNCSVTFRGIVFHNCEISDFKFEDKGEDFIYMTLTLITTDTITAFPGGTS